MCVKLTCMQCKQSDFVWWKKKLFCGSGKTDVRLSNSKKMILSNEKKVDFKSFVVWVKRMSD